MATIAQTSIGGSGQRLVTETTLTASDTFVYMPGAGQILVLNNVTAGSLTVTMDGADGTTVSFPGVPSISVAAGYSSTAIAAGAIRAIPLDTIAAYLQGAITVTGGTGIKAFILNPTL